MVQLQCIRMTSKRTIFTTCAIVVLSFLTVLPTIATEISNGPVIDLSALRAYHAVSLLQSERAIRSIFTIQRQGYLARADGWDKNTTEDNLCMMQTCKAEVLAPFRGAVEAVLAASLIVDGEPSPAIAEAWTICNMEATRLIEGICSAIVLALGNNSSEVAAEIQVIAEKQVPQTVTFNQAIFAAIRNNRNFNSKIQSTIASAQEESTALCSSAISDIFEEITTYASSRTQVDEDAILSTTRTSLDGAFSSFTAALKIKFDLLETLFMASSLFQFGFGGDCSVPGTEGLEEMVDRNWPTCKNDEPKVDDGNQSENTTESCGSHAARETATSKMRKGITAIFDTIQNELAKSPSRHKNPPRSATRTAKVAQEEVTAVYIETLNVIMEAILILNPKVPATVRATIHSAQLRVKAAIDNIYESFALIKGKESSKVINKIHAMEEAVMIASSKAVEYVFDGIERARIPADRLAKLETAQKEAITQIGNACAEIFIGIRIRIAEFTAGSQVETEGSTLSLEIAQRETSVAMTTVIDIILGTIQTVCDIFIVDQVEVVSTQATIGSYRQLAISKVVRVTDLIFNDMVTFIEVNPNRSNASRGISSNTETGYEITSVAFRDALDAIFSTLQTGHLATISEDQEDAAANLHNTVNGIYSGINTTQGSNFSTILIALQAIEDTTNCDSAKMVSDIFDGIRRGQDCDATTKATIDRAQEDTLHKFGLANGNIFDSIRTVVAAIFLENQSASGNDSSSITAARKEAALYLEDYVKIIFDSIDLVSFTCGGNPNGSCAA